MTYFVAVDIGCIECGEDSMVLGIFTTEEQAKQVVEEKEKEHQAHWTGQHNFEIFSIENLDEVVVEA